MLNVTVFQSASDRRCDWVKHCLETVRGWAVRQGFHYRFLGDELFDSVEPALRQKLAGRTPIIADIARLDLLASHLAQVGGVAVWVDSDTLCLDLDWRPDLDVVAGFGEECWIQPDDAGRFRSFRTPHNAFIAFNANSPVLPFLRYLARSIIERADATHIAPQMIGPKLIKSLNSLAAFTLYERAGALSPALQIELAGTPGEAVACYRRTGRPVPAMINLCHSLQTGPELMQSLDRLLAEPQRFQVLAGTDSGKF